jgi:transposase
MTDQERIQDLEAKLAQALTRISELEALVLKLATAKTSKNSHIPPSVDLSRKNQNLREKSDKPVGGQKGHQGYNIKVSSTPDEIVSLYPNFCNVCGKSLTDAHFDLASVRQVIDIPLIMPITTEFQCFGTECSCGHHQKGSFPQGVDNPIQYGKNIQSLAIYQNCFQFLPFARLQDFFQKVCHVSISKGTIENIIRRTAQKAKPVYEQLQQVIILSFFVGSDETSYKLNGKKGWFWVWQNALVTYIVAACSRSKAVIEEHFPDGLPNTILCSDRLAAQLSTITKGSQICLVHLLRDLNYLIESEKTPWASDFKKLLKDAIEIKQNLSTYDKNDPKILEIEQRADQLLDLTILQSLEIDQEKYKQSITFFKAMNKLRDALFPFLYDPRIPFDNNGSERAIRNVKLKMKISGQFKSLHQEFAIIRSVIDSAIKNGQSVFHAIQAMVELPVYLKNNTTG